MNFLTLLEFILFFGLMMFLHELGHYLMAKAFGIKVEEFGFGFPPRVLKIGQIKETMISLNAIPFGAFVRISGENDPEVPGGFGQANPFARILVLLGGPLMNLLTGVILFVVMFAQIGIPDNSRALIADVVANSPAEQAGLAIGDIITEVNNIPVTSDENLIETIRANRGIEISLTILRGEETFEVTAIPRLDPPPGEGALGIGVSNPLKQVSWIEAIPMSFVSTFEQGKLMLQMPVMLIRGEVPAEQARVVGPVGIYTMFSQAREIDEESTASEDIAAGLTTLRLMVVITIALGLTNLLPLPALDGGRILFILPEIIFRRKVPAKYENLVHFIGFIALIALMVFVTLQDIINPIELP